jgi:hypothetical protein
VPSTFAADVRFALRTLRHSPLFAVVAVLCISLGAGAVTTIFSVMNALVLQPLSGAVDARQLVRIASSRRSVRRSRRKAESRRG